MIVDENIVFLFKQAGAKELLPAGAKADGDGIRSFLVPLDVEGDGWVLTPKRKRILELPDSLYRTAAEAAREAAEVAALVENDYRDAMARGGGEFYSTVFAFARFGQDSDFATTRAMCPRTSRVDPVFGKCVSDTVYETVHAILIGAAIAGASSRDEIEAAGFVTVDDSDGMIRYFLPGMVLNYTPSTIDLAGRDLSVWGFKTWMTHIRVSGTATVNDGAVVGLPSPRAGVRYAVTPDVYALLSSDRDDLVTVAPAKGERGEDWFVPAVSPSIQAPDGADSPIRAEGNEMNQQDIIIVNLTPHEINILVPGEDSPRSIPASGELARVTQTREELPSVAGIPVTRSVFGALTGLPAPEAGKIFIVSALVAQHPDAAGCDDVFCPGEAVRDDAGRVIGCKGLSKI